VSDELARILEREPNWKALPSSTPAAIVHLIQRCLEKEAERRLPTMTEARRVIADAQRPGWRPSRRDIALAALFGAILVAVLAGYRLMTGRPAAGPPALSGDAAAPPVRPSAGKDDARPSAAATTDPVAERLYLQGRFFWNRRTDEDLRKSADSFQQAISRDPGYARAWAGLADAYLMLGAWSAVQPKDAYPRAKAAAERAIVLDESLAEPHASLGYYKTLYEWDWLGADREFRRAIELQPDYSTAHHWYAYYFVTVGDAAHAIERSSAPGSRTAVAGHQCRGRLLLLDRPRLPTGARRDQKDDRSRPGVPENALAAGRGIRAAGKARRRGC
jgi:tetratricopeptide (TPR) repeat protein